MRILQSGLDVDKFKIESTVVGKSCYLRLSSMNLWVFLTIVLLVKMRP